MADTDGMLRDVGLGMDAEAFLESDLGRAILDKMQGEAIKAMDVLKTLTLGECDGNIDTYRSRIQDAQNVVARVEGFEMWLVEIVETGRNTEENLKQLEAEENQ